MADVPVWAIILGIIGFLVNLVLVLLAWLINRSLSDIKESVTNLAQADRELANGVAKVATELSDHKLHVAEKYVRAEDHNATIKEIFNVLRETKDEIIQRVQEMVRHLEGRLNNRGEG